jgi:hypothetical protein
MDYRAPTAGLERKLGDLEEELARLRALPPPAPRKRTPRTPKAVRVLEQRLTTLERQLAEAGYRELTEREADYLRHIARMGVLLVVAGLAIASVHLVLRGRHAMTWAPRTCSIVEAEEDVHVARYVSRGKEWEFSASGHASRSATACWVPDPPVSGVGRLEPPRTPRVSLLETLSWGWLLTAGGAVLMGLLCIVGGRWEAENRRKSLIAPDDFSSPD